MNICSGPVNRARRTRVAHGDPNRMPRRVSQGATIAKPHMGDPYDASACRSLRCRPTGPRLRPMPIDYDAMSRVICVANGKGGVNKTSIVANIGGLAAAGGYRTLLVDLDPQGDLSDDLGFYANPADDHGQQLAAAILTG